MTNYQTFNFPFHKQKGTTDSPKKFQLLGLKKAVKDKTVIDLGCNEGYFSMACARAGAKYVLGIDNDLRFIANAKKIAQKGKLKNVEFILGDVERSAYTADVILLLGLGHHLEHAPNITAGVILDERPEGERWPYAMDGDIFQRGEYMEEKLANWEFPGSGKRELWRCVKR